MPLRLSIVMPVVLCLLIIAYFLGGFEAVLWISVVSIVIPLLLNPAIWHFLLSLRNTRYFVTTHKIIVQSGTASSGRTELPLERMKEMQSSRSIGSIIRGVGDIRFVEMDTGKAVVFEYVNSPESVRNTLADSIRQFRPGGVQVSASRR